VTNVACKAEVGAGNDLDLGPGRKRRQVLVADRAAADDRHARRPHTSDANGNVIALPLPR